ncbi:MAG: V-type ATP synthase subunit I [Promethearchaeota archaeon]
MTDLTQLSLFEVLINDTYKESLLNYLATVKNVQIRELDIKKEKKEQEISIIEKIKKLRTNLISLFNKLEIEEINLEPEKRIDFRVTSLYNLIGYLSDEVKYFDNRLAELNEYQTNAQIELENLNILRGVYKFLEKYGINRENIQIFNFFQFKVFTTFSKNIPNLELALDTLPFPTIYQTEDVGEDNVAFFLIYPKNQEEAIFKELKLIHANEISLLKKYITNQGINFTRLEKEIVLISKNISRLQNEKNSIRDNNLLKFFAFKETMENIELYNWSERQFLKTSSNNSLLTFYIPSSYTKQVREELSRIFKDKIKMDIIEITKRVMKIEEEPKKETEETHEIDQRELDIAERFVDTKNLKNKAPTVMKHKRKYIRHFEVLTKMYGVPAYAEIDPTIFVAISFPILFGIMFGDIGQGLALLIVGLIGARIYKNKKETRYHFSYIIAYCGIGATLAGLAYGEWFGGHDIFGFTLIPLLINPLDNIFLIFIFALFVGIVQICLGWFIQFINYWKQHKRYLAVTDSLFKIWILVAAGLLTRILYFDFSIDIFAWIAPPYPIFWYLLIPIILLLVSKPLGRLLKISYLKHESYKSLMTEGTMEAFELVLSTLSNVASYARLLALEMAHIGLMLTFTDLIALITEPEYISNLILGAVIGGVVVGIIGFIIIKRYRILGVIIGIPLGILLGIFLGGYHLSVTVALIGSNVSVIVLEGLLVFIHDLRLHFYEFFSKFYQGSGIEFKSFMMSEEYSKIYFEVTEKEDKISEELEKLINPQDKKDLDKARSKVISKFIKET